MSNKIPEEKILEKEISQLNQSHQGIEKKIIKLTKFEYKIEITIPSNLTECPVNIELLLIIQKGYPNISPKLFFKTNFAFPNLSDARDYTEDVLGSPWSKNNSIENIIGKIPHFIICYNQQIKEGYYIIAGKYYLGDKYDLNFIEKLPVYTKRLKQSVNLGNGKIIESNKLLMISDIYFCIFDIDNKNRNIGILSFWSNIKGLITIKRILHENSIVFVWRNKLTFQKNFELNLIVPNNGDEIINLILGKMDCFGINYNINRKSLEPKQGKIPNCDIQTVEKQIEIIEKTIREDNIENISFENIQFLMSLYESAIEYYSAINNNLFEVMNAKLQNLLKLKKINDFINNQKNNNLVKEENKEDAKIIKNNNAKSDDKENKNNLNNNKEEKKEEDKKEEEEKKEINIKKEDKKEEEIKKEEDKKEEDKKNEEIKKEEKKEDEKKKDEEIKNEEDKKEEKKKEEKKKDNEKKEENKKEDKKKKDEEIKNEENKKEEKIILKDKKDETQESTSLSQIEKPSKNEENPSEQTKTPRTLHVTVSNENEDIPIDIGSDDEEEDES